MKFLTVILRVLLFGLAYTQAPLYYSNQHQYFLHGLAQAGLGSLSQDILAQSVDPTPVFSGLVRMVAKIEPWLFHIIYALIMGVYVESLLSIAVLIFGTRDSTRLRIVWFSLFLAIHAAVFRWLSYQWFSLDYPWYFQAGVAGQYILGGMFQPSTFGVFLVTSVAFFLHQRTTASIIAACFAATIHPTYMLHAGFLTFAYLVVLAFRKDWGNVARTAISAMILIAPVAYTTYTKFQALDAEQHAKAKELLAHVRIPHHSDPKLWCDRIAIAQISWVFLAALLTIRQRIGPILFMTATVSLVLTGMQVWLTSDALALLFPWRIFAVLVPIATAIVLAKVIARMHTVWEHRIAVSGSAALSVGLAIAGVIFMQQKIGYSSDPDELPLLKFVKANAKPGDRYLIPTRIPDLKTNTRGSFSSDFKPAAVKKTDARVIPYDLQRFRLATGVPIYVDFKSVPYRDEELIAWKHRLDTAVSIYDSIRKGDFHTARLESLRITHIVTLATDAIADPRLTLVYKDSYYKVYSIVP